MSHYKKSNEGVVYIVFDRKILEGLSISANHASNLINLLGNIEGYPIWCSFAEYADGRVRAEFRSNGPIVQPIAVSVGGGGHAHASGAQLPSLDYNQIDVIIKKLDQAIIEWRKK